MEASAETEINIKKLHSIPIDENVLRAYGFNRLHEDGLYRWYGYRNDSKGNEWYVVFVLPVSEPFYSFQRQFEIKTVGDLLTIYENSTGEPLLPLAQ